MILVTGGAGYIGSHVTRDLLDKGYKVAVLDNLSTGHLEAVDKRAIFIFGDIGDEQLLGQVFKRFPICAVMHFSSSCLVGESVRNPMRYYQNNVEKTIRLVNKMVEHKITRLIFSSTCATYGSPTGAVLTEEHVLNPINPYGRSKMMIETILMDLSESNGLNYVSLRYFNVGGAHPSAEIGEDHFPETHLIPNVLQHLQGKTNEVSVFGGDYHTPDGTCVRDYIHVCDLSHAHILALEYLAQTKLVAEIFNLGNERGYSVLEIIKSCETISNKKARVKVLAKRIGDPPLLVASSEKIRNVLGWKPKYNLEQIIRTAWNWHEKHPNGFPK
ncbi:UDP-glucose 4-epimerase GalE [Neobacillus drentensis]|uniref:UDP-glucose 4-epimerase GalE n=1 Tax=Neobacillus drentensis TaxID=220684 RepID=UPI002FFE098D